MPRLGSCIAASKLIVSGLGRKRQLDWLARTATKSATGTLAASAANDRFSALRPLVLCAANDGSAEPTLKVRNFVTALRLVVNNTAKSWKYALLVRRLIRNAYRSSASLLRTLHEDGNPCNRNLWRRY